MSKIISNAGIDIYTESFGNSNNQPVLLIMGASLQSIYWYDEFCTKLATKGFFLIRYDNRGGGKSSEVDYSKNPYDVLDLTQDAISVIEGYNLKKAHIVGLSMGGQIAQFLGAYYPERVLSLTLISTSSSFKQLFELKEQSNKNELSRPTEEYIKFTCNPEYLKKSDKENFEDILHTMRLLEGDYNFNKEFHQTLLKDSLSRSNKDPYYSQIQAMRKSYSLHEEALQKIKIPTLIIQGDRDPLFPKLDHAESLEHRIYDSEFVIIKNMGHILNPIFNDEIIELLGAHFSKCIEQ